MTAADGDTTAIERLQAENDVLRGERDAARAQQAATAEVLELISHSPTDLTLILRTLCDAAVRLLGADWASLYLRHDDEFSVAAFSSTLDPAYWAQVQQRRVHIDALDYVALAAKERRPRRAVVRADDARLSLTPPEVQEFIRLRGTMSLVTVPLVTAGGAIGVLQTEAAGERTFTEAEVRLLQTFADQAVIAIENSRLIDELEQQRVAVEASNTDLRESLEQQTATAEVLELISRAPADLQAVLDAIVERSTRLLNADAAILHQLVGESLPLVAGWSAGKRMNARLDRLGIEFGLSDPDRLTAAAVRDRQTVHRFGGGAAMFPESPGLAAGWQRWGMGSGVFVPLLRGSAAFGVLAVMRTAPDAFTPAHIALLEMFAEQAVIAIENSRMFEELQQTNRELGMLNAQLAEATRQKSDFVSAMSHELRTPLNAVIGYAEILREDVADAGQDAFLPDLDKIATAGKHLLSLINDILDLNKIEAGRMDLFCEEFAVPALVREVEVIARPLVEKNASTLVLDCPAEIGSMHSDLTKVRQALFNLLSNAAKFTSDGSVSLTVRRKRRAGDDWLTFAITDTGIGMTEEQQAKLFQAFVQAEASTTRRFGGAGLGLALTRHFCQMLGGDVSVQSESGKGSTFTLHLPATAPEPRGEESPAAT